MTPEEEEVTALLRACSLMQSFTHTDPESTAVLEALECLYPRVGELVVSVDSRQLEEDL